MQPAYVQRPPSVHFGPNPYAPVLWSNAWPQQQNPLPYPYAHYQQKNPLGTIATVLLALIGLAAVGGGTYYIVKRRTAAKAMPPLHPAPPAVPGNLGVFEAEEVVALPDPVIFVLRAGESFDIHFPDTNVVGRFIEDYDSAPNTDELIVEALDDSGKIAEPFTAHMIRIGVPATWTAQSVAALKISPRGILEASTAKPVWVAGADAMIA